MLCISSELLFVLEGGGKVWFLSRKRQEWAFSRDSPWQKKNLYLWQRQRILWTSRVESETRSRFLFCEHRNYKYFHRDFYTWTIFKVSQTEGEKENLNREIFLSCNQKRKKRRKIVNSQLGAYHQKNGSAWKSTSDEDLETILEQTRLLHSKSAEITPGETMTEDQ